MTTSTMTFSGATAPASRFVSGQAAARQPALPLRGWINAFAGALAMARAVPSTGRINARQVEQVRAMAKSA